MIEQNEDYVKNTVEWNALNTIWRSCSSEQKSALKSDFEIVSDFIKKHTYYSNPEIDNDEYAYLNGISNDAKQFVISVVLSGETNLYHSIMAILASKPDLNEQKLKDYYFKKYSRKRPYLLENKTFVCEVIELCWHKFQRKKKQRMKKQREDLK